MNVCKISANMVKNKKKSYVDGVKFLKHGISELWQHATPEKAMSFAFVAVLYDVCFFFQSRFVQGYSSTTCYRINQWNFIDTFVYFSHNVVTIPPPCWTNCCHSHGVKVLGTFITEWDNGSVICSDILQSVESYKRFAKQLVDIACYYNFDGWLVNIENPIAVSILLIYF